MQKVLCGASLNEHTPHIILPSSRNQNLEIIFPPLHFISFSSSAMTSCNGLGHIFENKLPENPTLVESLSTTWSHKQPVELSSFTELFGELHLKESLESSTLPFLPSFPVPSASSSSSSLLDLYPKPTDSENRKNLSLGSLLNAKENQEKSCVKKERFSSMNSESLYMCTEGLGFESFEDVDGSDNGKGNDWGDHKAKAVDTDLKHSSSDIPYSEYRRLKRFPPPIPSIGRSGKPWVSYKSFRRDGRLVLKEVLNHSHGQEFMHACREDGRLTLHLVHRDEEAQQHKEKAKEGGYDSKGKMVEVNIHKV